MLSKITFTVFSALALAGVVTSQGADLGCGTHEATCLVHLFDTNEKSLRCYNPVTHTCKQNLLCPVESPARCGDSCFATGIDGFICHKNVYLCPAALPDLCGNTCYNKDSYECSDDYLVQH